MGFVLTNRTIVLLGAAVAAAAVLMTYPGGPRAAYDDATDAPAAAATQRPLARIHLMERIALKDSMVMELVAGRATLAEITARFQQLNADVPGTRDVLLTRYPGLGEEERAAMNVLDHVAGADLPNDVTAATIRRLAAEYHRVYGEPAGDYAGY